MKYVIDIPHDEVLDYIDEKIEWSEHSHSDMYSQVMYNGEDGKANPINNCKWDYFKFEHCIFKIEKRQQTLNCTVIEELSFLDFPYKLGKFEDARFVVEQMVRDIRNRFVRYFDSYEDDFYALQDDYACII